MITTSIRKKINVNQAILIELIGFSSNFPDLLKGVLVFSVLQ